MTVLPYLIAYLFIFLIGTCVASFCNVLVYRIPLGLDFVRGRSFCPGCRHALSARDLVPLFSYALSHGKCRYCGMAISARYPFVEAAGGLLAVLSVLALGFTAEAAVGFVLSCILLTVALIDFDTMEIPDGLTVALAVLAVASYWLCPGETLLSRLIGAACVSVPMLLIDLVIPTSFGGGDIKLSAAAGLLLGWRRMLVAAFFAILTGGGYGVYLLRSRRAGKKDHFAFGPFLCFGIFLAFIVGNSVLQWYILWFL